MSNHDHNKEINNEEISNEEINIDPSNLNMLSYILQEYMKLTVESVVALLIYKLAETIVLDGIEPNQFDELINTAVERIKDGITDGSVIINKNKEQIIPLQTHIWLAPGSDKRN